MKQLRILSLVLLIMLCNEARSQEDIYSNWFTPVRNKLFKINISKDTLVIDKQSFDLSIQGQYGDRLKMKVEKIILNNEYQSFIVSEIHDSILKYNLFVFKVTDSKKKEIKMTIDSYDVAYNSIAEVENEIKNYDYSKNEITLLSENEIIRIQNLKDINAITTEEFNLFSEQSIKKDSENLSKYKKFKLSYIHSESQARLLFAALGYNSLVKGNVFDKVMKKFTNPEPKGMSFYKEIYSAADLLNKTGKIGVLDTTIYAVAGSLDQNHPMAYFETAMEFLKKSKFNEACFLYYLGSLRYGYYNSSDPNYKSSGDGALAGSLQAMFAEPTNMYLRNNIDNFISIVNSSINYYKDNDYIFYSRNKDIVKYNQQAEGLLKMTLDLEKNRKKYAKAWKKERAEIEKYIDAEID